MVDICILKFPKTNLKKFKYVCLGNNCNGKYFGRLKADFIKLSIISFNTIVGVFKVDEGIKSEGQYF